MLSLLSRFGECNVAGNGKEAVLCVEKALSEGKPYDVMFLDIIMPVLDGQEALLQIRRVEREYGIKEFNFLKVIMVTAIIDFENITQAFEDGHCEAYLAKPFKEEELLEHLYELELIQRGT
jgi:two-component system chemotaxis response regulator CheY